MPHPLAPLLPHPIGCTPLPLFDAAGSRQLETLAAAGLAPHTLMRRAGLAVARLAQAMAPFSERIDILCGPGNNGGDGYEAALHLKATGRTVRIFCVGPAERLPPDAATSRQRAMEACVPIEPWSGRPSLSELAGPQDLLIDALLGRGLNRAAQGPLAEAIAAIADSRAPVLAIDIPSGLPGDSGAPEAGAPVVRARFTLALLGLAPGLFTAAGRDQVGDLWWDDLGADLSAVDPVAWLNSDADATPPRQHQQHKGSFGDVRVVGGAAQMAGAALLAGRAALHAGAGRVYVHLLDPQAPGLDPLQPDLMFGSPPAPASWPARTTVVAGCGGGEAIAKLLPDLLGRCPRLILDADALNALAREAPLRESLRRRAERGMSTILTPHPLEATRLLDSLRLDGRSGPAGSVQSDRIGSARCLAEALGCVVVLKGSGTVITAPGEATWINPTGNAALAVPGSGDVLAGWMAGQWSPLAGDKASALAAARRTVYRHGRLAERLSPSAAPLPASRQVEGLEA